MSQTGQRRLQRPLQQLLHDNLRANRIHASRNLVGMLRDRARLRSFRHDLRELSGSCPAQEAAINAFHFFPKPQDVDEFPFHAAMGILSAKARHPGATIFVFGTREPGGPYWSVVAGLIRFVQVPRFGWFGPAKLSTDAQRLEIVRLLVLLEIGGIAMDCDTLTLRNMDMLARHAFVLGTQAAIPGTRSAFGHAILAARQGSRFADAWLKAFESFDMNGGDLNWSLFVNELPMYLYAKQPEDAHILPHQRWFFPLWHRVRDFLFNERRAELYLDLTSDQYVLPLWSDVIGQELAAWQPGMLTAKRCVYAFLCRDMLAALPGQDAALVRYRLGLANETSDMGRPPGAVDG